MAKTTKTRISKAKVDAMVEGDVLRDTVQPSFGIRRRKTAATFFVKRMMKGRERLITIGKHGPWTCELARKEAGRILRDIDSGGDPTREKQLKRAEMTVADAAQEFMAMHGPTLSARSQGEYRSLIDTFIVPQFGKLKVTELERIEVERLHKSKDMAARPYRANFMLRVLSKLMSWAEENKLRPENSNPCRRIPMYKEKKRETFLTYEQFAELGNVLNTLETEEGESPYTIAAIRLYIFLGARKAEILTLQWSFVDLQREILRLPESKTGQKEIMLNAAALNVLRNLPRVEGNPYVIVGDRRGHHLVGIQKQWNRIRKLANIPEVRLHDLRHSFASVIADLPNANLIKLGRLLGHSNVTTTARYAHMFKDRLEDLSGELSDKLTSVMTKVGQKQ